MGSWFASMHLQTTDTDSAVNAARSVAAACGCGMLVSPSRGGWVNVYAPIESTTAALYDRLAAQLGAGHAIGFILADSDVLIYRYYVNGTLADHYNSCPDYWGEASDEDLAAQGNAMAFAGLLDAATIARVAALIKPRMINGECVGGEQPVFEEERLAELAGLMGVTGVTCSYDLILEGEDIPGLGSIGDLIKVGENHPR